MEKEGEVFRSRWEGLASFGGMIKEGSSEVAMLKRLGLGGLRIVV